MTVDYVLKRAGMFVLIIFVAGTLNFAIPRMRPTNPIEERMNQLLQQAGGAHISNVEEMIALYEERFGLNNPLWLQYTNYWVALSRLDFGQSIAYFPADVSKEIRRSMPWTIGLVGVSTVIAAIVGSLLGAWLGWARTPLAVSFVVPPLMVVSAIPYYLLGLLTLWTFTVFWPVLPGGGAHDPLVAPTFDLKSILGILKHATLPAATIVFSSLGFWGLGMRGMMVTTMGEDFIKLAEFKGLKERRIFLRYTVRNALLPQVTGLAITLGFVVSGSVLVEVLFAYPGIGNLLFTAITSNDYFLIQGVLMYVIFALGLTLFIVDMVYPLIDPRIRYRSA